MSIISAGLKLIARTANDIALAHGTKRAQQIAYKETGKAMRQANRKGYYIDGAKAYRKNYDKNVAIAKAKMDMPVFKILFMSGCLCYMIKE